MQLQFFDDIEDADAAPCAAERLSDAEFGYQAEILVMYRLAALGIQCDRVDRPGFDLIAYPHDGRPVRVQVKATRAPILKSPTQGRQYKFRTSIDVRKWEGNKAVWVGDRAYTTADADAFAFVAMDREAVAFCPVSRVKARCIWFPTATFDMPGLTPATWLEVEASG